MSPTDLDRATIFGERAERYARWRPTYPADAVDWVLPRHASRVVDVGAGTGALTGSLVARGLRVDAVEPDERMLRVLTRLHPGATAHLAGADNLPLPDASVDAVLAAQAWHWFPFEQSVREVRRILRPGGWLGLLWNVVAPVASWEEELAALDPDYRPRTDSDENDGGPFPAEETETATFPWVWHTTPTEWCSYLSTQSIFILMDEAQRAERLAAAHAILAAVCAETRRSTAPVQHEIFCARWIPGPDR